MITLSVICPVLRAPSERKFRKAKRPSAIPGFCLWQNTLDGRPVRSATRVRTEKQMIIGNENDQVSKGQLVDALACTGDEGRDTLR
jgi:hypothetical protein